ncbi:MAG TPA: ice-binding family protein [Acidimicrobiia bacterium]|nr:ice-binding family protein [Acidimicrobiia bacterium]
MTSSRFGIEGLDHPRKRRIGVAAIAMTLVLSHIFIVQAPALAAHVTAVPMETLTGFSVLAHTTITDTGSTSTFADGVGVSPGSDITTIADSQVLSGGIHRDDLVARQAQTDLTAAYQYASIQNAAPIGAELGGQTLLEGVHSSGATALGLTGTLTFDGGGNKGSVFIIQTTGAFTAAADAQVVLTNGAQECNVFWQVQGAVTLGANAVFRGTLLANGAVTVGAGANFYGRAFTTLGDMTLSGNTFHEPTCVGVTVAPSAVPLVTTEAGGTAIFTVVLNSQPSADVTIGVSSDDLTEGVVSAGLLTFTALNWATAQTVTVTGVDDSVVDGDVAYTVRLAAALGGDYAGTDPADVSATNTDDDTVGVTVTPSAVPLVTTEGGGTGTFTVVLDSQPSADVTIGVSSSDLTEGTVSTASLTFTTGNWNVAQTVTVTGVDDFVDDGNIAYTVVLALAVGGDYAGTDPADVAMSNTDNDTSGGGGGGGEVVAPATGLVDTSAACPDSIATSGFGDLVGFEMTTIHAIECISHYGISNGTSDVTFTPSGTVTRWQMALFLIRQVQVHGVVLPTAIDQGFVDIGGHDQETRDAIDQLAQLGITRGTGGGTFSPGEAVSRWEMALFLVRFLGVAGVPLPTLSTTGAFNDLAQMDPETVTAIDQLFALGVAAGTSTTTFEPSNDVLRWQMALFLTRVMALDGIVPS